MIFLCLFTPKSFIYFRSKYMRTHKIKVSPAAFDDFSGVNTSLEADASTPRYLLLIIRAIIERRRGAIFGANREEMPHEYDV